jgi:hypothetical protein
MIKLRRMRWVGQVVHVVEKRDVYRIWVGKHKGKIPLERPMHRWEGNIKMDLQNVGLGGRDWIDLAQNMDRWWALVNTVLNLLVP